MWLRTNNGLVNSNHVIEITAFKDDSQKWHFFATLHQVGGQARSQFGGDSPTYRKVELDLPDLTVLMDSVEDAKAARDKLVEKLNFEILD